MTLHFDIDGVLVTYVPPPTEFAVLVVHRDARARDTPQADHLVQSNAERCRYPAHGRPPLTVPVYLVSEQTWSLRHVG